MEVKDDRKALVLGTRTEQREWSSGQSIRKYVENWGKTEMRLLIGDNSC
jgi:hypothetical protein